MTIYADQFFPCSISHFRKLFKIIKQFSCINNVQEITEQLKQHFIEQIESLDARRKREAAKYWEHRQYYVDYGNIIESGKHPNGVKLTEEELKEFKAKYRDAKSWAHGFEMDFKRSTRQPEAKKKKSGITGTGGMTLWAICIKGTLKPKTKNVWKSSKTGRTSRRWNRCNHSRSMPGSLQKIPCS